MSAPRGSGGFTLLELLIALGLLLMVFGMIGSTFARKDLRRQAVLGAAEELAQTMRRARALAIDRKATFGIVFHIQNDPDSSGRVLNNRSGGHWYRIIRPGNVGGSQTVDDIPDMPTSIYGPYTVADFAKNVAGAWMEEAHVLPARKARFLALTDLDWGDFASRGRRGREPGADGSPTYPRPWFGWWDPVAKRLYPWGGYDPAIRGSGFYFWGGDAGTSDWYHVYGLRDPQPIGCRNPRDRWLDHWVPSNLNGPRNPEGRGTDLLYAQGSPRPLIDSAWRDATLLFLSDGTVRWADFMPARHWRAFAGPDQRGVPERCNSWALGGFPWNAHAHEEASGFDQDTGGWFITLAPDVDDDRDAYASASDALDALMPICRVFVSAFGEVRVITVSRTPHLAGRAAFPPSADWFASGGHTLSPFALDRLTDGSLRVADGTAVGRVIGAPITDFVTPEMLAKRQVWMR